MEILFELLLTILSEAIFELFLAFGWEGLAQAFGKRKDKSFPLACLGWFLIGAACGGLSAWIAPHKFLPWDGPTGLSLVLSPLLCGIIMKMVGGRLRQKDRQPTALASFWGGSSFAFGFSLIRFLLTGWN